MKRRIWALLAVSLLTTVGLATPQVAMAVVNTIYVGSAPTDAGGSCDDPDHSTDGSSMDVAMAAAIASVDADGDSIVVCNGTYRYEASIAPIESEYDFEIVAEDNGGVTLDGSGDFGLISVSHPASTLTIEGIRFVGAGDTGAIFRPDGDLAIIESVFLRNRKADDAGLDGFEGFGGGAVNGDPDCGDYVEIHDSIFISNSGPTGAVSTCYLTVDGSTFINNSTSGWGGAIYVCDLALTNSTFRRNSASNDGGAVNACEIIQLDGNTFERNVSRGVGGAISVGVPMDLENPWTGNTIRANRARSGGGIHFDCRPAASGRISASLRSSNRIAGNLWGNVEFDRDSCTP